VQLEALVALRHALLREVGVILRRAEAARDIVAAHGAGVGGHPLARAAEELMGGQAGQPSGEVPEGTIDRREVAVEHRARVEALHLLELLPDRLAQERVHPDDHLFRRRGGLFRAADEIPVEAAARPHARHQRRLGVRGCRVAVPLVIAPDV